MKKLISIFVLLALLAMSGPGFAAPAPQASSQVYIVQMAEQPVVAYDGGIAGYAATRPAKGQKINTLDPKVMRYAGYLDGKHDLAMRAVGAAKKLYDFRYSYNGFAAELNAKQVEGLKKLPNVLSVNENELFSMDTSSTPAFLGLDGEAGFWNTFDAKGENIVIGLVDSGIWPEHPSFSDRTGVSPSGKPGKLDYRQLPGWNAKCTPGEEFTAANCNQKLIGAQYFNESWGGDAGIDALRPWEFNSARDYNGHGTHTSSTAGGNNGVPADGPAAVFGTISGMAPRARISMYKALWSLEDASTASGYTADLVAAIDQAVADGVDVINYSISGSRTNFLDPVMVSFLYAADAGIFVATSAGNNGPTTSTVAHPGPWVTTVAAGTHDRSVEGSVTLGNGMTYFGASVANTAVTAPLINAVDAVTNPDYEYYARLCYSTVDTGGIAVLDPDKIAGKIVVCDRGDTARVNKSLAVMEAGGVGMILINTSVASLNADFHFVPSVHLQYSATDYAAIHDYADTEGATATINKAVISYDAPAPYTASFSSRGPLIAGGGDLLKPDLMAPGVDVLAAVAPPGNAGMLFNVYSGTSMSSPHVAGLAALFKELYPDWSPMMIKSALMTSAYDVLDGPNTDPLVIFKQGAGHVQPMKAAEPGLVFDAGWNDWLGFMCGTGQLVASYCSTIGMDPSDLNVASIAIGNLAGSQTVTRTVTNVGKTAHYTASVSGMTGFNVTVSPSDFTLQKGATQEILVTITRTDAPLNTYTGGQLTFASNDGKYSVRIPIVAQPVALAAPAALFGTGDPIEYPVTFGYTGEFSAVPRGLVAATTEAGYVIDDPNDGSCTLDNVAYAQKYPVTIPTGTSYARFSLFDDFTDGNDDLDLCVFKGETLVGSSGTGTSAEEINLLNPVAGTDYMVVVHGWGTDGPDANFTLFYWLLGLDPAGNMTVTAPTEAVLGTTAMIRLEFSGLAALTKYLGSVAYSGAAGMPNPTLIRIDTP